LKVVLSFLKKLYRWEYIWLCLIVLATLVLHFVIVANPNSLILDEQHYVKEARNIITNHSFTFQEHPPLSKLLITAGIKIFGDNTLGWRFLPIMFGTGGIVLFYFICRKLNMSNRAASIATFLLAFENMTFVQNSVAMLDVFYVFFMLAAFLLYLTRKYVAAGIAVGLSALGKLLGALAMPAMIIHWFFSRVNRSRWFALTVVLSVITFVVLLPVLEYIVTHDFVNPYDRIKNMLSLSGSLTFGNTTHPSLSRPWEWVIWYKAMPYWYNPNYMSAISPSVWALIIPAFAYLIYKSIKRDEAGLFGAAWFFSTYLLWIPLSLITNRVSYPFYFYPTVGAVCLGIGMGISQLIDIFKGRKSGKLKWTILGVIVLIFLAHIASFMILYPLFPIKLYK
jgi:dolichyl-phosphate-mannose-protein mannosyltransferase